MRNTFATILALLSIFGAASQASAQYAKYRPPSSEGAVGESYHAEFSFGLYNPDPEITFASESLGILGTEINAVKDLGVSTSKFPQFRVVLRPAQKHKLRFEYLPISYDAETTLSRTLVFNGQSYVVGLPVNSSLEWQTYRFGYEYDFLYMKRGFVGATLGMKAVHARVSLATPLAQLNEYAESWVPIPEFGGVARGYVTKNVSVTGELTYFKLPESVDKQRRYDERNVHFDLYGTANFTNNVGVQVGYRKMDVDYRVKNDSGVIDFSGLYFTAVARF